MSAPLILDTGGWLKALDGETEYLEAVEDADALYVPGLVLSEVEYFLRHRRDAMHRILREIDQGLYAYEAPTREDLKRADEIDRKFRSLDLGLVDSTVVALAERLGIHRVLTIDGAFSAVRFGKNWKLALTLVVPPPR